MAILTVAGVAFPTPTELTVNIKDITKADRNARGDLIAERINTKRTLEVSYKFLSAADTKTVLSTIQASFFFKVTYTDPETNSPREATFYAGDRAAPMMDVRGGVIRYKDVKFNFIEK
jgi:hypothetical protein